MLHRAVSSAAVQRIDSEVGDSDIACKSQRIIFRWKRVKPWALSALILGWFGWALAPFVAMGMAVTLFGAVVDKLLKPWRSPTVPTNPPSQAMKLKPKSLNPYDWGEEEANWWRKGKERQRQRL
jgi:hypothetical protein